jgi:hypothetical protein
VTAFQTPGDVLLRVSLDGGDVFVETGGDRSVEIELVPMRDNDVTRQAIEEARVELVPRGGRHEVIVELKRKPGLLIGRGPRIEVRIRCPHGSDLSLRAGSADLSATGTLGAVDVKTASGDISLDRAARLRVDTASGDVRARDVDGATELRTASGDVSLHRSGGPLTASLVSGDLEVDEAAAGLEVTTVSGDVQIRAAGGGSLRVQSVSGDVELAVKPGQSLYVDASSVSGDMTSELGLDDTPPIDPSAEVHELRVRTISGHLQIARASGDS